MPVSDSWRISRASDVLNRRKHEAPRTNTASQHEFSELQEPEEAVESSSAPEELPRRDVSADDFRDMMETLDQANDSKPSTQEIRRRLGLLDRARASEQTSTSDSMVQEEHESIQSDMMSLAKQLKERTQTINQSLVEDVKILDAVGHSAESNAELLERENAVLKQQLASSIGLWTSLGLVMAAFMVFMATYIYIKLFSRRFW
ncbi:hypothetical protein PINS_up014046 [Pythium insidiosum]|nr:hypothetical protein PINS_up014046 [Pythium insidiosum]